MPITGSQQALMYSLSGVLRSGAGRSGYYSPKVYIAIDGVARRTNTRVAGMSVVDILNETPSRASLTVDGFTPVKGDPVIITLGSTNGVKVFSGHALNVTQIYEGKPANLAFHLGCSDKTWLLNSRKVTKRYQSTSASDIAIDLISTYAPTLSSAGVVSGLATLDEITFTNEELSDCLSRIAKRIGGYWKVDPEGVVRLFVTDVLQAPVTLTESVNTFRNFQFTEDLSTVITRVTGEGGGANATILRILGDTTLPVETAAWYSSSGGTVISGPQIITYTGKESGGTGSTSVGVNQSPSACTAADATTDGNLTTGGAYTYKTLFGRADGGESEVSSASNSVTLSAVTAPGAPTAALTSPKQSGNLRVGVAYTYKAVYGTANGQTTGGTASGSVTPTAVANAGAPSAAQTTGGSMALGRYLHYVTFVTAVGETRIVNASDLTLTGGNNAVSLTSIPTSSDARVTARKIYRSLVDVPSFVAYLVTTINDNVTTTYTDTAADASISGNATLTFGGTSTATDGEKAKISSIPFSSDPRVTRRLIFRSEDAGVTYKLVKQLIPRAVTSITRSGGTATVTTTLSHGFLTGDSVKHTGANQSDYNITATITVTGTSTYTYTVGGSPATPATGTIIADAESFVDNASEGSDEMLSTSTATTGAINLTAIPLGPAGTTKRELYRVEVGGSVHKFLATIPDNSTTTYADTKADTALGAAAPEQSTWPTPVGNTTLQVTDLAQFPASGWVRVQEQVLRYTGRAASSGVGNLTGIPSSSTGSIVAAIAAVSSVVVEPHLTGVSGILWPINAGDPVNIYVTRNDAAAQSALAALLGTGDGIREDHIQDRRLSQDEIEARCDALLESRKDARAEVTYQTQDQNTIAGATITVSIGAPTSVSGTFKIQEVTIAAFQQSPANVPKALPWRTVQASNERFSLEDLLRQRRLS